MSEEQNKPQRQMLTEQLHDGLTHDEFRHAGANLPVNTQPLPQNQKEEENKEDDSSD